MAPDPHTGGDLSDMAASGTSIPGDAGKQNIVKSGPEDLTQDSLGQPDLASAAGNPTDIPRKAGDTNLPVDAITGTGDQLPAGIDDKRLGSNANNPVAKGHDRAEKHRKSDSAFDKNQGPEIEEQIEDVASNVK